eukprot:Partr_v1_DN25751_c0_g1_i1_m74634 putative Cytochrome p450
MEFLDILTVCLSFGLVYVISNFLLSKRGAKNEPPTVPYLVPFIGSMISFGMNPLKFLEENRQKFGSVYTFLMFGRKMTYLFDADGNNFVLNTCKLKEVSAEEAYKHLTTPVFGPGVVYDVENAVLMEQKRFVKHGLSVENLRLYVGLIEEESKAYFARWTGPTGQGELAQAIAELTIMTASRCLMGKEIRAQLSETVADLYCDLDKGFAPINFLFPSLPLPTYWRRDKAHIEMRNLFLRIMKERRVNNDLENADMLQALMEAEYRDGKAMTDTEVACLMIALLMAGQHTSSTTGTWCLSYLMTRPELIRDLRDEVNRVMGDSNAPLDYEALKEMTLLENCIKEALRLKPPIITTMRKVMEDVEYKGYVIPEGNYICVAPALSQLDKEVWGEDANEFNPDRFLPTNPKLADAIGHGAASSYLPFGAGRHRCIGESFAYIQLKTIIASFVRTFDFKYAPGQQFPETDFTTLIVMPVKPVMVEYSRLDGKSGIDSSKLVQREE